MRDAHTGQWQLRWMERVQIRNKIACNLGTWDGLSNYASLIEEYGNVVAIPQYPQALPGALGGTWYTPKS